MNRTKQILIEARDMIAKPGGWCQGNFRDSNGARCMTAAITDVSMLDEFSLMWEAKNVLARTLPDGSIVGFNDTPGRTQAGVVAAFDRAIESIP